MAQCTAKSKQSGQRCKRHATPGHNVCHIHGGKTPSGMALPQTKTGRYSKHLPTRLGERYETALKDPDLLALRDEIALTDADISRILEHLEEEMPEDPDDRSIWLEQNEANRDRMQSLIEQRRKLVETERKRLVDLQQMMTAEQAMVLLAAVEAIVRKYVDRNTMASISADVARLVAHQSR